MKPVRFLNLPVELICHILGYLEALDLLHCTVINKYLRKVALDSSRLQYTIELFLHRMVSVLPASSSLPFSSRLKFLRDREHAWKSLAWKSRHKLILPPTGSVYEFVGGLYGNGMEDDRRIAAHISFFELPSGSGPGNANGTMKMWTHAMPDIMIIDFTMDPTQDLLVLVTVAPPASRFVFELHLRTLSSNEPHPEASSATLPCLLKPTGNQQTQAETGTHVRVQVAGHLVALLVKEVLDSVSAHLEIWNWEAGPQHSCSLSRGSGIDDFSFLSHDTFLIVRPSGKFEVCTFDDPGLATSSRIPTLRATYALPQLSDGYMYWYISMSSNPAAGYVPSRGRDSLGVLANTYYPRPEERIHACCLYIFSPAAETGPVHPFVFFVNINTFLKPASAWVPAPTPSPTPSASSSTSPCSSRSVSSSSSSSSLRSSLIRSSTSVTSTPATSMGSLSDPTSTPVILPDPSPLSFHLSPPSQVQNLSTTPFSTPTPPPPQPPNPLPFGFHPYLPHLHPQRPRPRSITPSETIPWEAWGPQNTRWFEEYLSTDWQHALFGHRTVETISGINTTDRAGAGTSAGGPDTDAQADEDDDDEDDEQGNYGDDDETTQPGRRGRRRLRIRDFNPYTIRHEEADGGMNVGGSSRRSKAGGKLKGKTRTVTSPSTTRTGGVFTRDVVSSLPYTEVVSEETFDVTDVMMDDCRVLLLKRAGGGQLKGIDVLTL